MSAYQVIVDLIRSDFRNPAFGDSLEVNSITHILDQQKLASYLAFSYVNDKKNDVLLSYIAKERTNYQIKRSLFNELLKLLNTAKEIDNSQYIIIKGLSLNHFLYNDNPTRGLGDIDVLVKQDKIQVFHEILIEAGYSQYKGLTSLSTDYSHANAVQLAQILGQGSIVQPTAKPLKTRLQDCEYAPYHAEDKPVIEMHEGLHYLPPIAVEDFFKEAVIVEGEENYPTLSLENIFIQLIAAAYQNSESVASNLFDFGSVLRDYVDLKSYFEKYHEAADWTEIRDKIKKYDLCEYTGIILKNLREIYCRDVTYGCLSDIPLKDSIWKKSILERIQDIKSTRENTLKIMRKSWKKEFAEKQYILRSNSNGNEYEGQRLALETGVDFQMCIEQECLIVQWEITDRFIQHPIEYLFQCRFYPLEERICYTQFKVDIGFYDHKEFRAYGHHTNRLRAEAVLKQCGNRYVLKTEKHNGSHCFVVHIPCGDMGIDVKDMDNNWIFSAHVYQKFAEGIYQYNNSCGEEKYLISFSG